MSQIQIRLGPILGDIDLTVLIRAHGTGINVDIWVQLLRRDLQPPRLQQPAQRGRGDALSQSGNNAACHENILCHVPPSHRKFKKEKGAHQGTEVPW